MEQRKMYYKDCHLAGRKYHDADEVWDELIVGTLLRLERDIDNRYDANAVAVMYDSEEKEESFCIGYIPRSENATIAILLEMGWNDIFECRISRIAPDAHPEQQITMTIKVKRNETK